MSLSELHGLIIPIWILISAPVGFCVGFFIAHAGQAEESGDL